MKKFIAIACIMLAFTACKKDAKPADKKAADTKKAAEKKADDAKKAAEKK
ncbi:MAG: hypothetical protein P1V97_38635 [Planctomycetota bacterium]|nr:hypothetical protein [Planctomycetota bacterium]